MDRAAHADLSSYVRDGTFAGHLLILSPDVAGRWGGQRISHATLDEMARYSRSRWAAVPTIVEADAAWLGTTTAWSWLDGVWAIYSASAGDAATWVGRQASAAGRARLGIMLGMNVLNGGTSASGIRGTQPGKYAMSATQLRNWAPPWSRTTVPADWPSSAMRPVTLSARTSRVLWPSWVGKRRGGRPSRAESAERRSQGAEKETAAPRGGGFRFGACGH